MRFGRECGAVAIMVEGMGWLGGKERQRGSEKIDVRGYIYRNETRRLSPIASVSVDPKEAGTFQDASLAQGFGGGGAYLIPLALCFLPNMPCCCTVGLRDFVTCEPFIIIAAVS